MYDAIIVGGGPAGLSAALILGRCRRRVVLFDTRQPRNARSRGLHGFLTREGIQPLDLLNIGREQLKPYAIEMREALVVACECNDDGFSVTLEDGSRLRSRKLLLATGVVDRVPQIAGIENFYGTSVFHCPFCDGWEMRDQPLVVYGRGVGGAGLAISLRTWSTDVVLCTDGITRLGSADRERLARRGIEVRAQRIARLEGTGGVLERIVFQTGEALPRRGMFFSTGQGQACALAEKLGCQFSLKGAVRTNHREETNVPGLYVAGDASRDVQLAIVAAAEGAKAGIAIHKALEMEADG